MQQFLETIKILDGVPQHLEDHQRRLDATMQFFFPRTVHDWRLKDLIEVPVKFKTGLVRCRAIYDEREITIQFFEYLSREIRQLKLIEIPPGFDYRYKYADRQVFDELFSKKGDADDILMTRDGWITDTSIANIAFEKNGRWYTPAIPLLAGTTWKRLVAAGVLIPTPIHQSELGRFTSFKLFNAMLAFVASADAQRPGMIT